MRRAPVADRIRRSSPITGWFSGAPRSFQSGNSSVSALGPGPRRTGYGPPAPTPFPARRPKYPIELLETDRRGKSSGAGADNHDIIFHRLPRPVLFEKFLWRHSRLVLIPSASPLQPPHWTRITPSYRAQPRSVVTDSSYLNHSPDPAWRA